MGFSMTSHQPLIDSYSRRKGGITWIGAMMGSLDHYTFWLKMNGWHDFVGVLIPDFFPVNVVRGALRDIVKAIYTREKQKIFDSGAERGDKLWNQFNNIVKDTKAKIEKAISDARTKIERELINPLKAKIASEIEPRVNDLLSRVKTAESTIKDAENRINEALSSVTNLENNVASLNQRLNSLKTDIDKTISDFQSKMNNLEMRLGNADTKLSDHAKDLKELFDRVKALEEKISNQGSSLDWFRSQIEKVLP